jgi:hypothetical protein
VNNVDDDQITACRELNFYSYTNARSINDQAFPPINPPRCFAAPAFGLTKPGIEHPPHSGSAVGILLLVDTQGKPCQDLTQLIEQWG